MDLKIILSKVSQKEKDKYHIISLIWGISNMTQMNLSTKQKKTHRHERTDLWLPRGRSGWEGLEETNWEFRVTRCEQRMDKQGPTVSTENYIQYSVINHSGKECKKKMYV